MKKMTMLLCALILLLVLSTCIDVLTLRGADVARMFFVEVNPIPENGELILSSNFDMQGTGITVYVLPDPGFVLDTGSIGFRNRAFDDASLRPLISAPPFFRFTLLGSHTEVTARFVPNTDASRSTVSVGRGIENGFIVPGSRLALPGELIEMHVFPSSGYVLDPHSFRVYEVVDGQNILTNIAITSQIPYTFTMPGNNVLITAEFVPGGFKEIAEAAGRFLRSGRFDTAAAFYETAYRLRSQATAADQDLLDEVIFYHSIGRLASILIDGRVRQLLGPGLNNLNMNWVPSTLDEWMGDAWYSLYRGIDYNLDNAANENRIGYDRGSPPLWRPSTEVTADVILPNISYFTGFDRMDIGAPSGFPGDFGNSPLINMTASGRYRFWHSYFFLMLCQTRYEGLNLLLERIDEMLFGRAFEEAAAIAATLRPEARVPLYDNLKNRFRNIDGQGLERYFGPGDTYVGRAELDFIFGMARLARAAVQFLRGYNWFILGQPWLIDETVPGNGIDQILNHAFALAETNELYINLWNAERNNILPLRGRFLEIRNALFIRRARDEFSTALGMLNRSMLHWFGLNLNLSNPPSGSNFSQAGFQNYRWAAGGFMHAYNALRNNTTFFFPRRLPAPSPESRWPTASGQADFGINPEAFFSPGAFSLRNLVVTDPRNHRAPAMYRIPWYFLDPVNRSDAILLPRQASLVTEPIPDDDGAMVAGQWVDFMLYTFALNMDNFREIFPRGFEQTRFTNHYGRPHTEVNPNPEFNPDLEGRRAFLFEVFPAIPIWPERPTFLSGPGNGGNRSAQHLYNFFHDIR